MRSNGPPSSRRRARSRASAAHELRAARGGVQAEGSHVAEAVEHAPAGRDLAHGAAVVLLVEEEAGLLAVLEVEVKAQAVLAHHEARGLRRGQAVPPALVLRQALLGSGRAVVALVDRVDLLAVRGEGVHERAVDHGAQALHAHGAHLRDQHVLVAVGHEAGQVVGFGEGHAAAGGIRLGAGEAAAAHRDAAVLPRPRDAARPEGVVEAVVGVAAHHADADLGLLREQARALPGAVLLEDVHDRAVLGGLRGDDLALEDPRVPAGERARRLARNDDAGIRTCLLHVLLASPSSGGRSDRRRCRGRARASRRTSCAWNAWWDAPPAARCDRCRR